MEPTKSNGAVIGSVIVVLILILGGLYLWQTNSVNEKSDTQNDTVDQEQSEQSLGNLNAASTIEADLNIIERENNTADAGFDGDVNQAE